jgi:class 3 adenylate cyclase
VLRSRISVDESRRMVYGGSWPVATPSEPKAETRPRWDTIAPIVPNTTGRTDDNRTDVSGKRPGPAPAFDPRPPTLQQSPQCSGLGSKRTRSRGRYIMPTLFRIGNSASQDRLESLIEKRMARGADQVAIDQRIWDLFGETWAVMFTDLDGFSRRAADFGIVHFLQTIYESQRLLVPIIDEHDGILLKMEGDSMLLLFRRPSRAIACAIGMQRVLAEYNATKNANDEVLLCIGLGYGPMLRIGDNDVFGLEVNAASKLGEDTAIAYEILATNAFVEARPEVQGIRFETLESAPPGANAAYRVVYPLPKIEKAA